MSRLTRASLANLALLLLTVTGLSAQAVVGLHVGANFSKLGGADVGSSSTRTGIDLGASLTANLSGNLGVQVGAFFAQKGATDSSGGADVKLAIDYVVVPVLLHVGIPSTGPVSAHVLVGPAVSFQARCNAKGSGGGVSVTVSCNELGADLKTVEMGAMGGLGVNIKTSGKLTFMLDALYNLGLTSIDNTGGSVKNRAFTLRAGVGFPLG